MRIRAAHLIAATALAVATAVGTLDSTAGSGSQPVSRFVAFQTCQAAMWQWTADNAKIGTTVGSFRHHYRPQDVWPVAYGWHVQTAGRRGEPVTATDDAAFCIITGTNSRPTVTDAAFPR